MKSLQIESDDNYGYCDKEGNLHINIQKIWEDNKNEDLFIEHYSKVYTHELLHDLLFDYYNKNHPIYLYGEDMIIYKLMSESWDKDTQIRYMMDTVDYVRKNENK
jgi:hypothetical protein